MPHIALGFGHLRARAFWNDGWRKGNLHFPQKIDCYGICSFLTRGSC
jgi:hypothetical protein